MDTLLLHGQSEQTLSVSAETFMEDLRAVMVLPHFRFRGGRCGMAFGATHKNVYM